MGVHSAGVLGALFNGRVGSAHFGLKSTVNGSKMGLNGLNGT